LDFLIFINTIIVNRLFYIMDANLLILISKLLSQLTKYQLDFSIKISKSIKVPCMKKYLLFLLLNSYQIYYI